jgi:transcriptional regulator with XRE-family HTH domain
MRMERLRRGMSIRELSAATGISEAHLGEIELRRVNPMITTVVRIARGLGVTDLNLIIEPDPEPPVTRGRR